MERQEEKLVVAEGVVEFNVFGFRNTSEPLTVVLPSTLRSVGGLDEDDVEALYRELDLETIRFGVSAFSVAEGNPCFKSVSGLLLTKDGKTLVRGVNGNVTIPNGVTRIGDWAFSCCTDLVSVTIPDSVKSIGKDAFFACKSLANVMLGGCAIDSGDLMFYGCSGLRSFSVADENPNYKSDSGLLLTKDGKILVRGVNGNVTIPNGVTCIGDSAFSDCSELMSVTIPDSVTSIGESAFFGCDGLTSVTIPDSVTSIGVGAFDGCGRLENVMLGAGVWGIDFECCGGFRSFSVAGENSIYKSDSGLLLTKDGKTLVRGVNGNVTIPNGVTRIGYSAFSFCSELTSVTIPNSVTNIGNYAFFDCSGLTSVTVPDSVTSIGFEAFYGCGGLTSIEIPDSVTEIGEEAFSGTPFYDNQPDGLVVFGRVLYKMKGECPISVTIPDGITSIGDRAFSGCRGLTSVTIPDSVTEIEEFAFDGTPFYDNQPDGLVVFGRVLYKMKGECPISVTIPDGIKSIEDSAFEDCGGLTSVTIPDSVTRIGESAFSGCSGLTSVTIPDSVTSIGESAFSGCSNLKNVVMPKRFEFMQDDIFYSCHESLKVTYI